LFQYGKDSLLSVLILLEVKSNLPDEWVHPKDPKAAELARNLRNPNQRSQVDIFEPGKFKESSSAMASFVESVLFFELIRSWEQSTLKVKDGQGLKWSISPELVDDKR
jgi:hypothetical protein